MKHRVAIPSKVSEYGFHEKMFLAGFGDKWTYRPIPPKLVRVGEDGPPAPFDATFPQTRRLTEVAPGEFHYKPSPYNWRNILLALAVWGVIGLVWWVWRVW